VSASLPYGVKPGDPLTLLSMVGLLLAVGILAALDPARRAARIAPVAALRHE